MPLSRCFDAVYGLELVAEDLAAGTLEGRVEVTDAIRQPSGDVHGGVMVAMAEALASRGTFLSVWPDGNYAIGLSNDTQYTAPVRDGHLHARAQARSRTGDVWLWDVETRDDRGEVCAVSAVRIVVRSWPASPSAT